MFTRLSLVLCLALVVAVSAAAQVPVREEPRHKPVLENKYFRLLDVWLPAGDTTMYHIHATPSLFVILSSTHTASQMKDSLWGSDRSELGRTWYRSFINDTLVHRVANIDTIPFHVNDIEILAYYDSAHPKKALPFTVLFENERAFAYRISNISKKTAIIKNRGPIIIEPVSISNGIAVQHVNKNTSTKLESGKYLYIPPGNNFYLTSAANENVDVVLFEIK